MQEKRGAGVVAAVLVAVVILGSAIFYRFNDNRPVQSQNDDPNIIAQSQQDTDGDGLKDFEELELGTDPNNADTDGDGTSDYHEVLTGRDPLTPAPYDVLDPSKLSLTDWFVEDIVIGYGNGVIRENGDIDTEAEERFVETIAEKYSQELVLSDLYTLTDLHVVGDTEANKERYRVMLKEILSELNVIEERETLVMLKYYETKDPKELEKIDVAIETYDHVVSQLVAMPVPKGIAPFHLPLVNSIYELNYSLAAIRLADIDPLRGTLGADAYLEHEAKLIAAAVNLSVYLALTPDS